MGKWLLYKNSRSHLTLVYLNLVNGTRSDCGEVRADTPEPMVLDWIMSTETVQAGDLIQLPGQILTVGSEARA